MAQAQTVYRLALALAAAGLLASAPAVWAQGVDQWDLRGQALGLTYRSDVSSGDPYTTEHHHYEQATGLGFEAELRSQPWLGFAVGISANRLEVRTTSDGFFAFPPRRSRHDLYLPTIGLNLHPVPGSRVDVYLGPTLGVPVARNRDHSEQLFRNDFAIGGVLGLGVTPGRGGWGFTASVRYMRLPVEGFFDEPSYLYTYLFGAGASYRF